jgi:8-oxo-dGTP pyrophosphatase MutT (NUDIX family)
MPVIVLATSGRDVLISQSGKWLTDVKKDPKIFQLQKIPGTATGLAAAKQEALRRADSIGSDIKYTPLVWKTNPDRWSTRFLTPMNPPGFIKGTFPDSDFKGETEAAAAVREFKEETGYDIRRFPLQPTTASGVFTVEIPESEKAAVIASWKAMGREGEIYELRWEPIVDIRKDVALLNAESKTAVQFLPVVAGKRKTRRRKSKTIRMKRAAYLREHHHLFKVLAHPTRRALLSELREQKMELKERGLK